MIDIDYDGTADLLVLFRDGRPVFFERGIRAFRLVQLAEQYSAGLLATAVAS